MIRRVVALVVAVTLFIPPSFADAFVPVINLAPSSPRFSSQAVNPPSTWDHLPFANKHIVHVSRYLGASLVVAGTLFAPMLLHVPSISAMLAQHPWFLWIATHPWTLLVAGASAPWEQPPDPETGLSILRNTLALGFPIEPADLIDLLPLLKDPAIPVYEVNHLLVRAMFRSWDGESAQAAVRRVASEILESREWDASLRPAWLTLVGENVRSDQLVLGLTYFAKVKKLPPDFVLSVLTSAEQSISRDPQNRQNMIRAITSVLGAQGWDSSFMELYLTLLANHTDSQSVRDVLQAMKNQNAPEDVVNSTVDWLFLYHPISQLFLVNLLEKLWGAKKALAWQAIATIKLLPPIKDPEPAQEPPSPVSLPSINRDPASFPTEEIEPTAIQTAEHDEMARVMRSLLKGKLFEKSLTDHQGFQELTIKMGKDRLVIQSWKRYWEVELWVAGLPNGRAAESYQPALRLERTLDGRFLMNDGEKDVRVPLPPGSVPSIEIQPHHSNEQGLQSFRPTIVLGFPASVYPSMRHMAFSRRSLSGLQVGYELLIVSDRNATAPIASQPMALMRMTHHLAQAMTAGRDVSPEQIERYAQTRLSWLEQFGFPLTVLGVVHGMPLSKALNLFWPSRFAAMIAFLSTVYFLSWIMVDPFSPNVQIQETVFKVMAVLALTIGMHIQHHLFIEAHYESDKPYATKVSFLLSGIGVISAGFLKAWQPTIPMWFLGVAIVGVLSVVQGALDQSNVRHALRVIRYFASHFFDEMTEIRKFRNNLSNDYFGNEEWEKHLINQLYRVKSNKDGPMIPMILRILNRGRLSEVIASAAEDRLAYAAYNDGGVFAYLRKQKQWTWENMLDEIKTHRAQPGDFFVLDRAPDVPRIIELVKLGGRHLILSVSSTEKDRSYFPSRWVVFMGDDHVLARGLKGDRFLDRILFQMVLNSDHIPANWWTEWKGWNDEEEISSYVIDTSRGAPVLIHMLNENHAERFGIRTLSPFLTADLFRLWIEAHPQRAEMTNIVQGALLEQFVHKASSASMNLKRPIPPSLQVPFDRTVAQEYLHFVQAKGVEGMLEIHKSVISRIRRGGHYRSQLQGEGDRYEVARQALVAHLQTMQARGVLNNVLEPTKDADRQFSPDELKLLFVLGYPQEYADFEKLNLAAVLSNPESLGTQLESLNKAVGPPTVYVDLLQKGLQASTLDVRLKIASLRTKLGAETINHYLSDRPDSVLSQLSKKLDLPDFQSTTLFGAETMFSMFYREILSSVPFAAYALHARWNVIVGTLFSLIGPALLHVGLRSLRPSFANKLFWLAA